MDADAVARWVERTRDRETDWPLDIRQGLEGGYFEGPPWNEVLGPTAPRGGPAGLLLRSGRIVASWGDCGRVDMTFSSAKSYLSLLAGLALADGLIADLDEAVGERARSDLFEGGRNGQVTWRHLLQQTSEWTGVLWGKPDVIDHNRQAGREARSPTKGVARALEAPGSRWEYNDVRVNLLALALLLVFRRPLPEVFRERIMAPIGTSTTWRWEGYRNSYVDIGGERMQSVPGGAHWGGGMFINTFDQARIALLVANAGRWREREVVPAGYLKEALSPCALNPSYGLLWWLNTERRKYPAASARSVFALGTGGNVTWIDPERDLVGVLRWTDTNRINEFFEDVYASCRY
jgi:CubicO group peptidase (beta-lactamase class C family)